MISLLARIQGVQNTDFSYSYKQGEKDSIYLSRTCSIVSAWRGLIDDT